jgi:ABC-type multidrug transport system ATPase subunit
VDPAVSVHDLSKRFGERVAFQDLTFDVGHGEVFGFLGPNGAGKTTTVRRLGTLIAPSSGSATIAGIPLTPENGEEIRDRCRSRYRPHARAADPRRTWLADRVPMFDRERLMTGTR